MRNSQLISVFETLAYFSEALWVKFDFLSQIALSGYLDQSLGPSSQCCLDNPEEAIIMNIVVYYRIPPFNPFTLRLPPESIVCYFHTLENKLGIKQKFIKYLKESCCLTSG